MVVDDNRDAADISHDGHAVMGSYEGVAGVSMDMTLQLSSCVRAKLPVRPH